MIHNIYVTSTSDAVNLQKENLWYWYGRYRLATVLTGIFQVGFRNNAGNYFNTQCDN